MVMMQVFRDNKIDGGCLPLLTESHLTTGLGLKLGPALKLLTALRYLPTSLYIYLRTTYLPMYLPACIQTITPSVTPVSHCHCFSGEDWVQKQRVV